MDMRLAVFTGLLFAFVPSIAAAQQKCEGGEWFCDDSQDKSQNGNDEGPQFDVPDSSESPEASGDQSAPTDEQAPPEHADKIRVDRVAPPAPPRRHYPRREWGLNLHILGALMGDNPSKNPNASMSGAGLELRYRTVPHFAFVAGLDFVGGTDWNGDRRAETGLSLGGMVFFNPQNLFQLYMPMGIGFSGARVTMDDGNGGQHETRYSYFGAYIGLGAELRVARRVALNLDILGFGRTRTDVREGDAPEYTDPNTGLVTNSSGGGLVRGGVTFYW